MQRLLASIGLVFFVAAPSASAQIPSIITSGGVCNFRTGALTFACIPLFVAHLVQIIFFFVGTIALIQIIISGYQFALGKLLGDDEGGKKRLRNAIIGFTMCVCAFLIIDIIIGAVVP